IGVAVGVAVGVTLGFALGVGVGVGVPVSVGVALGVGVPVGVAVGFFCIVISVEAWLLSSLPLVTVSVRRWCPGGSVLVTNLRPVPSGPDLSEVQTNALSGSSWSRSEPAPISSMGRCWTASSPLLGWRIKACGALGSTTKGSLTATVVLIPSLM